MCRRSLGITYFKYMFSLFHFNRDDQKKLEIYKLAYNAVFDFCFKQSNRRKERLKISYKITSINYYCKL